MQAVPDSPGRLQVALVSAPMDHDLAEAIAAQLAPLEAGGDVRVWHAGSIRVGDPMEAELRRHVSSAGVVVLLVSAELFDARSFPRGPDLVALALARAQAGAKVLKVLARSCLWTETALAGSSMLDARGPLLEAAAHVAEAVRAAVRGCPLEGAELDRYLEGVAAQHGAIVLAGLSQERAAGTIGVHEVFVSVDATRADARGSERGAARRGGVEATEAMLDQLGELGEVDGAEAMQAMCGGLEAADAMHALRGGLEVRGFEAAEAVQALEKLVSEQHEDPTKAPPIPRDLVARALRQVGVSAAEAEDPVVVDAAIARLAQGDGAIAERLRRQPIDLVLRADRQILLEGDAGAGKTTVLKHVAMALVQAHQRAPARAEAMGFSPPYPLPAVVLLRRFGTWLLGRNETARQAGMADLLVAYLRSIVAPSSARAAWIERALQDGSIAVLLDGLDEVADTALRDRVADVVRDFVHAYPRCPCLVTSRPTGLSGQARRLLIETKQLRHASVQPLDDAQVERFVRAWYGALERDRDRAAKEAADLVQSIRTTEHLRALARTPILLTAIGVVHLTRGRLPEKRAELYETCVKALAHQWDEARAKQDLVAPSGKGSSAVVEPAHRLSEETKLGILQVAALKMQLADTLVLGERALIEIVRDKAPKDRRTAREDGECRELVHSMAERSGILMADEPGKMRFRHLQFQEFLAARAILKEGPDWLGRLDPSLGQPARRAKVADLRIDLLARHLAEPRWAEVVPLAIETKALSDAHEASEMVQALVGRAEALEPAAARVAALAPLARAVLDLRLDGEFPIADAVEALAGPVVSALEDPAQPGEEPARIQIAEALSYGREGDPRLTDERRWVEVPEGWFWQGSAPGDRYSGDREKGRWVRLWGFRIQRWPVTVAEYARFVDAGGYADDRWWPDSEGQNWRGEKAFERPEWWREQQTGPMNVPVFGVSWWEADAYCRWLAATLDGLREGEVVRLPTEAEWEKAARGGKEQKPTRIYPWEGPWDASRANVESRVGKATPVGCYAKGHGPYGACDQAGNVREWCADWYDPKAYEKTPIDNPCILDPAKAALEVYEYDPGLRQERRVRRRAARGGNWWDDGAAARVFFRGRFEPWRRRGDLGLRCVAAPSFDP